MAVTATSLQEMGLFLIKSLDAKKNLIASITPSADGVSGGTIQYKTGTSAPIKVSGQLSTSLFCNGYVVVRNNRENVQTIIDNWDKALTFETMVLIFLDDKTGNKWLLRPNIHAKIAEPKTLSLGLMTLFEHSMGKSQ